MDQQGRILVIETASEACSVALFEGGTLIAQNHQTLGRGHAERLIPMIEALPDRGRADTILTSLGPGSFTGVRIGIAAARALGVAWHAKVMGYPTLALLAAMARSESGLDQPVTVCVNGGHGEWFVQDFGADGLPSGKAASLTPEAAAQRDNSNCIAGNRAEELAQLISGGSATPFTLLPDASMAALLAPASLTVELSPIYGRPPDAKPQTMQGLTA